MKKILLIAVLLLFAFLLVGCEQDAAKKQHGIVIEENESVSYSAELKVRAEDAVFHLMKGYYEKTLSFALPEVTLEKIRAQSKEIAEITQGPPLNERQYRDLVACVEKNTGALIDALTATSGELPAIKALYRELSALTTPAYVSTTVYHILCYFYDYEYQASLERYEKYGYPFLLLDAERLLREKSILQNEVGQSAFGEAARTFFFFAELLAGGAYEQDMIDSFSDEEILILLQSIDFGMEGVTPEGFALLLSYLPSSDTGEYFSRLWQKAKENGDTALLAERMRDVLRLFKVFRDKLEVTDCRYVRERDFKGLILSLLRKFGEEDWTLLGAVTAVRPHNEDYDAIAAQMFGEAYATYLADVKTYTLEELKQSVDSADFVEVWKGYVAGICPALAYGMSDD